MIILCLVDARRALGHSNEHKVFKDYMLAYCKKVKRDMLEQFMQWVSDDITVHAEKTCKRTQRNDNANHCRDRDLGVIAIAVPTRSAVDNSPQLHQHTLLDTTRQFLRKPGKNVVPTGSMA